MKLTRVKGSSGLVYLKSRLTPPLGTSLENYYQMLCDALKNAPSIIFVMMLWEVKEEEKDPLIHGHIIALALPGVEYVALLEVSPASSHPALIDSFNLWVEMSHRMSIRFECFKGRTIPEFLKFQEVSRVLESRIIREVEGTDELPSEPKEVKDASDILAA